MKDYEINVKDIQLNYWHSHSQQTGLIPEVPDPHKSCKNCLPISRPPLLPLRWISRWCKECPLTKRVIGLSLAIMANRSVFLPSQLLAEKRKFWNPTLSDIMCSRIKKKPSWTKIADLGIIFLRRRYPIHWYQSLYTYIIGSMPFRFVWATLYRRARRGGGGG